MEANESKKLINIEWNRQNIIRAAVLVVVLALVIWLCISISNAAHMQNEYTAARNAIAELSHRNLYMILRTYESASLSIADVKNDVVPTMKQYYRNALALDEALANGFGNKYAILSFGLSEAFETAFSEFDLAVKAGRSTDKHLSNIGVCVSTLETALGKRFDSSGALLPAA